MTISDEMKREHRGELDLSTRRNLGRTVRNSSSESTGKDHESEDEGIRSVAEESKGEREGSAPARAGSPSIKDSRELERIATHTR